MVASVSVDCFVGFVDLIQCANGRTLVRVAGEIEQSLAKYFARE